MVGDKGECFFTASFPRRITLIPFKQYQPRGWFQYLTFLLLSFLFSSSTYAQITINEILTSTDEEDEFGASLEWIEFYNASDSAINLLGYTLSDDPLAPTKWMFGAAEIPARGFFRVWATGYDLLDRGNYHTNFRLDRDGDLLALYRPDGTEEDVLNYPIQRRNISYGRKPDGEETWYYFSKSTPGFSNSTAGVLGFVEKPSFSVPGGIYSNAFSLELSSGVPDTEIRYTLNGSEPTEASTRYVSPISVTGTSLVRARVFRRDYLPSPVATHTYIFRESIVLPILSLVADPNDLFGKARGIYANPGNHGRTWERPVSVEFFTKDGQRAFQENAGIRIHGGASRTRSPKKSFRLYFRSEYGAARLKYPLFPHAGVKQFNQIVVRGGFNDTWGYDGSSQRGTAIYVSDQTARDLHKDMGQLASDGIFVELYVNGENWGIYNPSERIEEDFFEQHTGIKGWTVVADGTEIKDGNPGLWSQYSQYILQHRFNDASVLEELDRLVNRESFTSFLILNVWVQNYDWPHHNWLCARSNDEAGRWLYLLWDMEYSFGSGMQGYRVDINVYERALSEGPIGTLFSKIIKNPEYRAYYWRQIDRYLETALSEKYVLQRLNARLDEVRGAIPWEAEKWGYAKGNDPKRTPKDWEAAAQLARDFVSKRTPIFLEHTTRIAGPRPVSVMDWALYQ